MPALAHFGPTAPAPPTLLAVLETITVTGATP